jgi:hypothetical protein
LDKLTRGTRRIAVVLFSCVVALTSTLAVAQRRALTIPQVQSGRAELVQQGRLTILEISARKGAAQRIALTHPSDYRQGINAPYKVRLIAESPDHFLIFTDTFAANPGNVQGRCGAADESFVHIVALGAVPHETLSTLFDSCLLDIQAAQRSPEWVPKPDSAGFVGHLVLRFESGTRPSAIYYVAPDGSVTRPESKPDA